MDLHTKLKSITDKNKDLSIRNLLKSELKFGKANHIFVCYHSETSRTFAKTIQSSLKDAFGNELVICNHEDDFIPGCSILQNITTTIRESIKVVLILSKAFINSSWCSFEAEYTLSLKLDMKESKTIIPLYTDNYSLINKPTFLKPFSVIDCTLSPDIWYPELIEGLNTEIKQWKQLTEPPSLANGKEYHFVTFIDRESNSKCDNICQVLEELKKDGFIGHILSIEHFFTLECFQVVEEIVLALEKISKILIFSHENLAKNQFYLALVKLVKMFIEDKRIPTTYIIPVKLDGASVSVLGDTISYLDVGITDGYLGKLKDAIARTGECRFCFPDEAVLSFENGIFRVADFECPRTEGDTKDPRILDMCFIRRETRPHLIIIDADNMKVKFLSILGNECIDGHTFSNRNERPNRLSKINEDSFALIYENNLDIAIFDIIDKDLKLTRTVKVDSRVHCIKSLVAFSDQHFLLTNGSDCFSFMNDVDMKMFTDKSPAMSLARRLTKSNRDDIFIADENDRRLIWLDKNGNTLCEQDKWNRNLHNVRGIASGNNRIYAAVNNAVVVFNYESKSRSSPSQSSSRGHDTLSSSSSPTVGHDTSSSSQSSCVGHDTSSPTKCSSVGCDTNYSIEKEAIRLIKFQRPIDHNRAICLDSSEKYLALSQVINGKDTIRVFKLH